MKLEHAARGTTSEELEELAIREVLEEVVAGLVEDEFSEAKVAIRLFYAGREESVE